MIGSMLHMVAHVLVPGLLARVFFRSRWVFAWVLMLATMLVDADHLLADPIFAPNRCSIGFHPLHKAPAIAAYAVMTIIPASRILGLGLLTHMALDGIDCLRMTHFSSLPSASTG